MKDMMDNNVKRGDMRFYKGQAFVCTGFKTIVRRDDTETWLTCWEGLCLVCNKSIKFEAPTHSEKIYPVRRCKLHKQPGRRA